MKPYTPTKAALKRVNKLSDADLIALFTARATKGDAFRLEHLEYMVRQEDVKQKFTAELETLGRDSLIKKYPYFV